MPKVSHRLRQIGITALLATTSAADAAPQTLAAAFAEHVKAVQARDLKALEATITSGADLTLILPNGTRTTSRTAYLDFHREFFGSKSWTIAFEVLSQTEDGPIGVVSTRSTYDDVDEGEPIHNQSWVTFVFRWEQGRWKLIHDQNTRLPKP